MTRVRRDTNQGFLYFVTCDEHEFTKIGVTCDANMNRRIKSLQTGSPFDLRVDYFIRILGLSVYGVEETAHQYFANRKHKNEWFALDVDAESAADEILYTLMEQEVNVEYGDGCAIAYL